MNAAYATRLTMGTSRPPIFRMVRIHELLREGRPVNCAIVGAELEVSAKTVQRDANYMRDQLALPIEYDASAHTYRYTRPVDSAIFGAFGQPAARPQVESHQPGLALPLDAEPAGYLRTICERHGLQAEHVLRAILGEALTDAVCNPGIMSGIVRAARALAVQGEEEAA